MAVKKLVTLKEVIELLNDAHDIDPKKLGRNAYSEKTIYNAVHSKRVKRYGPRHIAQFDAEEIMRVFGPKKAS